MTNTRSKKSVKSLDPHRAREAKKYDNPIPSREFIMELLEEYGAPLGFEEIRNRLSLDEDADQVALSRRLKAMERDGQLICNRRGAYCIVNRRDLIVGRVIGHRDGFGFLKPDDGGDDIFIGPREMRAVFHDDRAVVRVTGMDRRNRLEGSIVEVLERNTKSVVGRLYQESGVGFVVPDNKRISLDIVIPRYDLSGAEQGQMVLAEIVEQPTKRTQPIGRISEVLGEHMAPGMEVDIAIRTHNLPLEWPEDVEAQMATLSDEVPEHQKEGKVDLRDTPLVTIDGADARDFDDAVFCERKAKGWRLLVCIADVSSYVTPGSALDVEAQKRGNSVYFPDRVIPMLPEKLSNGLCSINPHVDRLCMTCELYVDEEGKISRSKFFEGVMRSHARLTYDEVAALLEGDADLNKKHKKLVPHLRELHTLFRVLNKARGKRGAIDFDTTETRFVFNEEKKVERIVPVVRNDAHRLIEECMLAANVAAARLLERKKLPALYRIHEGPNDEKLSDLRDFLGELGLSLPGGKKPKAGDYAQLLSSIKERPDAHLIQTVMLRSLSQAVYSSNNVGHFGLSYAAYTHFTSPIRRYPDLVVHRALKHLINSGTASDFEYSKPQLQSLGEHSSSTERRADEATRDAVDWLKCEYMMDKVGESYDGIISSVNSFGVFVELQEIYVDGLVHITALANDYYHFEPVGHRLVGERTGQVFRLGDPLRVKVAAVNLDDRKIDFVPDDLGPGGYRKGAKSQGGEEAGEGRRKGRSRKKDQPKDAVEAADPGGKRKSRSRSSRRRSKSR